MKIFNDFESWKYEIEVSSRTYCVKSCGSSDTENLMYRYFKFNRNGFYYSKRSGHRHLKTQGSNKVNGYCSERINVVTSSCLKNVS